MAAIDVVLRCAGQLCEGPSWDGSTQRLIWVDILSESVHILDPETGKDQKYDIGAPAGAAVPRRKGGSLLVATGREFKFLDIETGKTDTLSTVDDDKPKNRLNDGKCDPVSATLIGIHNGWKILGSVHQKHGCPNNRVQCPAMKRTPNCPLTNCRKGTMGPEEVAAYPVPFQGSLYVLDRDRKVTKALEEPVSISNGLAWSGDHKTLYYIDTPAREVTAFDYDIATGKIANKRQAVPIDESYGFPDGMCIDAEGMLWVAMYGGGQVVRFDPKNGSKLETVKFPATRTTSCCWGGSNLDELFVTSEGGKRLSKEERDSQPLAGSVFRVKNLGVKGLPSVPFDG